MTITDVRCEYCKKTFRREKTLMVHMCERKRRHMHKGEKHVQLAFRSYQLFYRVGTYSKKEKTFDDFASSQYYTAFVKYAEYCIDLKVDDVPEYTTWLLKNQIRIDRWCSDRNFSAWIKTRLKTETPDRAIERTILFMQDWGKENNQVWNEYFRLVAPNLAVFHICSGKVSPWVVYGSSQAQALIDSLSGEQLQMVSDYVDPYHWQNVIKTRQEDFAWVEGILVGANL
jgi:hypothetical protein|tara:strand:+ start:3086 stop:3769 length:684 start_codon:yes stop_codon:yes gene_type:complete